MNENEFEYNSRLYVKKDVGVQYNQEFPCNGCAFSSTEVPCYYLIYKNKLPPCSKSRRIDGNDVIFVEVEEEIDDDWDIQRSIQTLD